MHTFDDAWYDRIGEGLDQNEFTNYAMHKHE